VHRLTIAISIRTNGNALRLTIQVRDFLQHDDGKEGETEHGSVAGVAIEVPKLRKVHGDALGLR
jgi:hypothetical protein